MDKKVDFRDLKQPGTYPDLHEKLARELAFEYQSQEDHQYSIVSWANQEKAQKFFNEHGFVETLDHMLLLRDMNLRNWAEMTIGEGV